MSLYIHPASFNLRPPGAHASGDGIRKCVPNKNTLVTQVFPSWEKWNLLTPRFRIYIDVEQYEIPSSWSLSTPPHSLIPPPPPPSRMEGFFFHRPGGRAISPRALEALRPGALHCRTKTKIKWNWKKTPIIEFIQCFVDHILSWEV